MRQNSVNQYFVLFGVLGVLFGVLGVLFGVFGRLFGVFGVLFCVLGVLFGIFSILVGVLSFCLVYLVTMALGCYIFTFRIWDGLFNILIWVFISPQSERSELGAFYFCPGVLSGYCCV